MPTPLRIFYAAGPGDVIGTYGYWKAGQEDPREVSATYSGQFYSLCRDLGAHAMVVAQRPGRRRMRDGNFAIAEMRTLFQKSPIGMFFHLGQMIGALRLAWRAERFDADVAVVAEGTHWFALAIMRALGIRIIPDIHCTLWPAGHPPRTLAKRLIRRLNGRFWCRHTAATLCISPECERQVLQISQGRAPHIIQTRPGFSRERFQTVPPPDPQARPFVLLYAGRIEENKGVFDLLEVMQKLQTARPGRFKCILCGSGGADKRLAAEVARRRLSGIVELPGQLNSAQLLARLAESHALIVPTTAAFVEGLNRVAIEGVLAGRPVIVTTVCPASEIIAEAAIVVPPGDVEAMAAGAARLESDAAFYRDKRAACAAIAPQFYGNAHRWGAGLKRAIEIACGANLRCAVPGNSVLPVEAPARPTI